MSEKELYEAKLRKYNIACAVLHGVQAVAVLAIGLGNSRTANFRIPQTTQFVAWNASNSGVPYQNNQLRYLFPFVAVTSSFAWLSFAAHAAVLIGWDQYIKDLRRGVNQFRWYEYALSSSVMIVLIGMLFGVWDIMVLFLMGCLNACMNLFGLLMETMNCDRPFEKTDWSAFNFGCFAGIVPWITIFCYIGGSGSGVSSAPAFVWAILATYFVMFNSFPVNMILQYRRTGWYVTGEKDSWFRPDATDDRLGLVPNMDSRGTRGYYFGEKVYQILSLVAKTLLLWLVVGGANQPSAYSS